MCATFYFHFADVHFRAHYSVKSIKLCHVFKPEFMELRGPKDAGQPIHVSDEKLNRLPITDGLMIHDVIT